MIKIIDNTGEIKFVVNDDSSIEEIRIKDEEKKNDDEQMQNQKEQAER